MTRKEELIILIAKLIETVAFEYDILKDFGCMSNILGKYNKILTVQKQLDSLMDEYKAL